MDLLQRLLFTALGAVSVFYVFVQACLSHWKSRGILHSKPRFLWGNVRGVGSKRHISDALQTVYAQYKQKAPFVGFYACLKPMVLIVDLELINHILHKDAENFNERGLYSDALHDPLAYNLVELDGAPWQRLHAQLSAHCLSTEKVRLVLPGLLQVAAQFRNALHEKLQLQQHESQVLVINELVDCYNVDVIATLAFGLPENTLRYPLTEFHLMTRHYLRSFSMLRACFAFNFPGVAHLLRSRTYSQTATKYFLQLVRSKVQRREWNSDAAPTDFLQYLVEVKHALRNQDQRHGHRLNDKQIAAQAFSFVLAGLDACNSTLAFSIAELALQPELQQQLHSEIRQVLERHNDELTADSLQEMRLLQQVLYETLRKHSPYPFLLRRANKEYEVPDSVFVLRAEDPIIIPVAAIHHDPDLYPEPERFDPKRFDAPTMSQRHAMSFLPFGGGLRGCIGQVFAELQLLVGLATLMRDYKFSICAETSRMLDYDNTKLTTAPKREIQLRVERIDLHQIAPGTD